MTAEEIFLAKPVFGRLARKENAGLLVAEVLVRIGPMIERKAASSRRTPKK